MRPSFQEVGFPPQSPIGLGSFSSTSLSHPVSWIEFQIACILPGCGAALALGAIARRFLFLTLQGVGFPPQLPAGLGGFLSTAVYQNNHSYLSIFPPQFSLG